MGKPAERRFADGRFCTPSGRARFFARAEIPPDEPPDERFPLVLTTGRTLNQWHTRTKTGTVPQLNQKDPAPYLQMHPDDAAELDLRDGQRVEIESRRGKSSSVLRLDPDTPAGTVFLPIHWNELWSDGASCNEVTSDLTDPISRQPALKHCAVTVRAHPAAVAGTPKDRTEKRFERASRTGQLMPLATARA